QGSDEKSGDDEEDIDSNESAGEAGNAGVIADHGEKGDGAQTIYLGAISHAAMRILREHLPIRALIDGPPERPHQKVRCTTTRPAVNGRQAPREDGCGGRRGRRDRHGGEALFAVPGARNPRDAGGARADGTRVTGGDGGDVSPGSSRR